MSKYGYPDGMTIDTEGMIWVSCYSARRVVRFDPSSGKCTKAPPPTSSFFPIFKFEVLSCVRKYVWLPSCVSTCIIIVMESFECIHLSSLGQEIGSVDLPVNNPTSCCFGGSNYDQLYITSAVEGDSSQLAGSVFLASGVGSRGRAGFLFKGNM